MSEKPFWGINIWDDYHDDGYIPEGKKQETFAYIEQYPNEKLDDENTKKILFTLKELFENFFVNHSDTQFNLHYEDTSKKYPSLINTENEHFLYKRWEIKITNITHKNRELLVENFEKNPIKINDFPVIIYSES